MQHNLHQTHLNSLSLTFPLVSLPACRIPPMAKCFPLPLSIVGSGGEDDFVDDGNEIIDPPLGSPTNAKDEKGFRGSESSSIAPRRFFRSFSVKLKRLRQRFEGQNFTSQHGGPEMAEQVYAGSFEHTAGAGELKEMNDLDEADTDELPTTPCLRFRRRSAERIEGVRREGHGTEGNASTNIVVPKEKEWTNQASCTGLDGNIDGALELCQSFQNLHSFSSVKEARNFQMVQVFDPQKVTDGGQLASIVAAERYHQSIEKMEVQCGCFPNWKMDKLRGWGSRTAERGKTVHQVKGTTEGLLRIEQPVIPDDIIEMFLARLPFSNLVKARLVCKKWRALTMSRHFLQMREAVSSQKPWLFVFGLSRDGVCMGQIQALDPTFNRWHAIQADPLSGRFLYSVAAIGSSVYIIGGCSSLPNRSGRRTDKTAPKTHKGVLAYSPLTSSWKKVCSMSTARAVPIVGVFEVKAGKNSRDTSRRCCGSCCDEGKGCYYYPDDQEGSCMGRRLGPHDGDETNRINGATGWCSLCRMGEFAAHEEAQRRQETWEPLERIEKNTKTYRNAASAVATSESGFGCERPLEYGLIVVGGQGVCNEPLHSAEVYDPTTNKWRDIAGLPADHGVVCAGAVSNGVFYAYSETDKLAAYNFEHNVWTSIQLPNPPSRLHEYIPKLIASRDKLFLLGVTWEDRDTDGGVWREKATRMLWELNPMLRTWSEVSKHPDAPLDWNAVFVSEGDQIFGVEMFKIFGQVLDFITVCDTSGSVLKWNRVSRMHMANDMDVSSCITKTAVVAQL